MRRLIPPLLLVMLALSATAATELVVTVVDRKTGEPVTDLTASDFAVTDGSTARSVGGLEFVRERLDIVLMLDSSMLGEKISSLAPVLIQQLGEGEQMSLVSFDSSAELVQDFTSSQELLLRALEQVKYGNSPRMTDALYAVAADGFAASTFRRVILLLTTGVDGPESVSEEDLVQLCRRDSVSVFSIYLMKYGRSKLERIARLTGGAAINVQQAQKSGGNPAANVFEAMRGHYVLTLPDDKPLGRRAEVDVKGNRGKGCLVSWLEVD